MKVSMPYLRPWQRLIKVTEEEADDEHEVAVFVPFQWPRMATRTFYKESDPDWQEFARVAGDEEKLNTIKGIYIVSDIDGRGY